MCTREYLDYCKLNKNIFSKFTRKENSELLRLTAYITLRNSVTKLVIKLRVKTEMLRLISDIF